MSTPATIDRTPREAQTREAEARTAENRVWKPASTLPDPIPQAGWSYRWVMTHLMGEANHTNTSQRFREGYEPVKASDHPELAMEANAKGNIEIGGLMLCKIPSEMMKQRTAYYQAQTNNQANSVNAKFLSQSDARMPAFVEGKSATGVGRGSFGNGN